MHIYKMSMGEGSEYDVQNVNWKKNDDRSIFFIDNDDNPFNGEMILF